MNNNQDINDYIIDEEVVNENISSQSQDTNQNKVKKEALLAELELEILKDHLNESQENQKSRKNYAKVFTWAMIIQLIVINLFVLSQGKKWITLDVSIFNVFLIGVFTQLVAIVTIIFTNIFPKDHDKNKTDLQRDLFRKSGDKE